MTVRQHVFPQAGDDLAAIAARELPGVDGADQQLLSWNLHLAARADDRAAAERHRVHRATAGSMTAIITRATVVGGHDGRAEIEVELTYDNGGTSTISLDEEACTASLDGAGVSSLDELVGQPWSIVLPALEQQHPRSNGEAPCSISSSVTD